MSNDLALVKAINKLAQQQRQLAQQTRELQTESAGVLIAFDRIKQRFIGLDAKVADPRLTPSMERKLIERASARKGAIDSEYKEAERTISRKLYARYLEEFDAAGAAAEAAYRAADKLNTPATYDEHHAACKAIKAKKTQDERAAYERMCEEVDRSLAHHTSRKGVLKASITVPLD
jgi:hypothetical protein